MSEQEYCKETWWMQQQQKAHEDYLKDWQKENLSWVSENRHKAEDWVKHPAFKSVVQKTFEQIGQEIGRLTDEKNIAYGDSFNQSCKILAILYPNGVNPNQYKDILAIARIIDKLFRIATMQEAFGENPWQDIAGYAILKVAK